MNQFTEEIVASDRKLVRVTCEGLPDDFTVEAYANGFRWKGYATPMFALEAGLALRKVVPEKLSYDVSRRVFRYIDIDADYPEVEWIEPEKYDVGGEIVDLFMIGENWCWELADDCNAGTGTLDATSNALHLRVRPAALTWLRELAAAEGLPLADFGAFLIGGYVEQRMEGRKPLDLSGFDPLLCIAKNGARLPEGAGIIIQPAEWLKLVDALFLAGHDDAPFNLFPLPTKREILVESILDQLSRELGRV